MSTIHMRSNGEQATEAHIRAMLVGHGIKSGHVGNALSILLQPAHRGREAVVLQILKYRTCKEWFHLDGTNRKREPKR